MKSKLKLILFFLAASSITPNIVFAIADESKSPQWYEIAGGIIAIPAAIIGIFYSIELIKKTRLESQKAELEINEKRQRLKDQFHEASPESKLLIDPIIKGNQIQLIILRFILLYITIQFWDLAAELFGLLNSGILYGIQSVNYDLISDSTFQLIYYFTISKLPSIAKWIIIIGLGLPLFKDISRILKVDLKKILLPWSKKD